MPKFITKIIITKLIICFAIFFLYGARSLYSDEALKAPSPSPGVVAAPPADDFSFDNIAYANQDYSNYSVPSASSAVSLQKEEPESSPIQTVIYLSEEEAEAYKDSVLVWKDFRLYRNNHDADRSMTLLDESLAMNNGVKKTVNVEGVQGYESSITLDITQKIIAKIHFKLNSFEILDESKPFLDVIGSRLNSPALKDFHLMVQAHTCSLASYEYNLKLSMDRAISVRKYLSEEMGVDEDRIMVAGASYLSPIASNDTEEGRSLNRRVEFLLYKPAARD
jgi:outer membrane protein OmpA-like peptidoglycan-associated protein